MIANELEACPEKKLKSEGDFKMRIVVFTIASLLGRNLETPNFTHWVKKVMKSTNSNRVISLEVASRPEKVLYRRYIINRNKGVHTDISVTVVQKLSYFSTPRPFR